MDNRQCKVVHYLLHAFSDIMIVAIIKTIALDG